MTPGVRREGVRLVLERVEIDLDDAAIAGLVPRPDFATPFATVNEVGGVLRVQPTSMEMVRPASLGLPGRGSSANGDQRPGRARLRATGADAPGRSPGRRT